MQSFPMKTPYRLRFVPTALALLLGTYRLQRAGHERKHSHVTDALGLIGFVGSAADCRRIQGQHHGQFQRKRNGRLTARSGRFERRRIAEGDVRIQEPQGRGLVRTLRPILNGNEVLLGSSPCTFSMAAKYNVKTTSSAARITPSRAARAGPAKLRLRSSATT